MGGFSNFAKNYVMGKERHNELALEEEARNKQTQDTQLFGQMLMGDQEAGQSLMQSNPNAFMQGQNYLQKQSENQLKQQQAQAEKQRIMNDERDKDDFMWLMTNDDYESQNEYIDNRIGEIVAGGGDPRESQAVRDMTPEQRKRFLPMAAKQAGLDVSTATSNIGNVSPKDFTVESLDAYENSGEISDLVRFRPKTIDIAGIPHKQNEETQKWEPLIDLASEEITEQAAALAEIEADKKSREDFGKKKTKWFADKATTQNKISSAQSGQKVLEDTASEIKKSLNEWTTGYGASLSKLPKSEARKLKNLIDTLQAHSAFSTLVDIKASGGTLGAISEAELTLLKAKLGALDQKGDTQEMVRVIDQILNSNLASIDRLNHHYNATDKMYSGSYNEMIAPEQEAPPSQEPKSVNWADL